MLAIIRRVLGYRLSVIELIGLWFMIALPYQLIGLFWSLNHSAHLSQMSGADKVMSFLGQIVFWPVLLFSDVCMT